MKKNYLETGKVVGTHGIRGQVRIQPWCDSPEFLCAFKKLYLDIDGKEAVKVTSAKPHGNIVIASFKGVDTIEQAECYRNKVLYIDRKDVKLEEGQYFIEDLIGCNVYDVNSNDLLGKISDVSQTGANDVWHIECDGKEYLIPNIPDVVISVDIESEKVVIKPLKGIFDDED